MQQAVQDHDKIPLKHLKQSRLIMYICNLYTMAWRRDQQERSHNVTQKKNVQTNNVTQKKNV
jgi:hypothetical protein